MAGVIASPERCDVYIPAGRQARTDVPGNRIFHFTNKKNILKEGKKNSIKTTIKYYIALKFCKVFIKAQGISLITTGERQMSSEVKKGLKGKAFSRPVYRRNKADVYVMCLTVCGGE